MSVLHVVPRKLLRCVACPAVKLYYREHSIARYVYLLGKTCTTAVDPLWTFLLPSGKPPTRSSVNPIQRNCGTACGCSALGSNCLEVGKACSFSSANCELNTYCCTGTGCTDRMGCRRPGSTASRFCATYQKYDCPWNN